MAAPQLYVLDLETTTNIEKANQSRKELLFEEEAVFICAAMYAPISPTKPKIKEYYGKNNAENAVLELPEGRYYTWNGARFDLHFIYHLLRKAGYNRQESTRKNESKKKQLKLYEFNYLLAGSRLISLVFRNHHGTVELRDACLLFTCSLKKFIENTCPEYPKLVGTYDYKKYREYESDFTETEIEYCRYDIFGFSVGMHRIQKDFAGEFDLDIFDSFTAGSFAMKYAATKLEKKEELFPPVTFDRKFVFGGRTYVNPLHAGKIVENTTKIDANSYYPSAMVKSKLPYGHQKKIVMSSDQLRNFLKLNPNKYVFAHLMRGSVKYNDMFSPIVTTDDLNNRDYPTIAGSADMVYLDDNILRDPRFEHKGCIFMCYIFEAAVGILDYMAKVFELKNKFKKEEKYALELAVKIILNATYGKFIQRESVLEFDFFDGIIAPTGHKTNLNSWFLYAPMGAAITANCRYELCNYMNLLRERFIYCDTDSLVFIGEPPAGIPLGLELGEWKVEACPEGIYSAKKDKYINKTGKAIFFQRKTYAMDIDGHTHVTFCGISSKAVAQRYPEKLEHAFTPQEIEQMTPEKLASIKLYVNGVSIEQLQKDMRKGITFDVLQGNHTLNGIVLVERARTKKYLERY
jgi:hypothetical protein